MTTPYTFITGFGLIIRYYGYMAAYRPSVRFHNSCDNILTDIIIPLLNPRPIPASFPAVPQVYLHAGYPLYTGSSD